MARDQFEVDHPSGLRITRLPVGVAAGRCWLTFVFANQTAGEPLPATDFFRTATAMVSVRTPAGDAAVGGPSGGSDGETADLTFRVPMTASREELHVVYLQGEAEVARETIALPAD
jgi:hypothetical protein